MTEVECSAVLEDFVNTGRTGRRNAVPDILDEKTASVSTGGLPFDMEKLNCSGMTNYQNLRKNIKKNTHQPMASYTDLSIRGNHCDRYLL